MDAGEQESHHLKHNTATTEDDTLMGTDVGYNVIYRLKEIGCECGPGSGMHTCAHDNVS